MSEINLNKRPEELIQAEQLVIEGKFEKAHELMNKFLERRESTLKDSLLCNLLKIDIMIQQGLYEEAIKLANQTYNESLGLRENILAFDALDYETKALVEFNRLDEAWEKINEGEELLEKLPRELPREYKKRRAALQYLKAFFYIFKSDADEAKKHFALCIPLFEEIGDNLELAYALFSSVVYYAVFKGEFDPAIKNLEKGLDISKKNNWKYGMALGLLAKGVITSLKGDVEHSTIYNEQSLALFKELNNKDLIAHILNNISWNYMIIGDMERAIEFIESSMKIRKERGNLAAVARSYDNFIKILIEKGDLEKAQKAIEEFELLKNQLNDKEIETWYLFSKALVLKTSSRSRDRIEAEDILKQIIKDETITYEYTINALLLLCELLLIELRISNDLSFLEEINSFTAQLLEIAEKNHSFILFAEIYFLKAKLALLTLDLKTARRFLTQAQRIAERFGYNQLAAKITLEHEKLRNQLSMWDNLGKKEISLSERLELAGMDGQMKYLLQNRAILTVQVKEKQITVHKERKICIVCKGDILGFMYACKCDALYCEKCARALTEIENVCWVCNNPIDITKPIKPYKEKEVGKKDIVKEPHKNPKNGDIPLKK